MPTPHIFQVLRFINALVIDPAFLIACLILCRRKGNPKYIRIFPIMAIANLFLDISAIVHFDIYESDKITYHRLDEIAVYLHFAFPFFEIIFFGYILFQLCNSRMAKKNFLILSGLFALLYLTGLVFFAEQNRVFYYYFVMISMLIKFAAFAVLCLSYFMEIFKKPTSRDLAKEPAFWIISGILFYFSIDIISVLFGFYFAFKKMFALIQIIIAAEYIPALIIMLLFIKAFTCRTKPSY
jgi:hypothetical protein